MTPDEFTNQEFYLDVGGGHRLYVHDWGNAKAKTPVLYLHGGPGNGCDDRDKRGFDPTTQRVIFHDQRGSGKSTPAGSLEDNNTQALINDIEKIAEELKLEQFVLVGGSWGSTLALAYGIEHPEKVSGMVLNGIFTATEREINWLSDGGWREFFPDVWWQYLDSTPPEYHDDPTGFHLKRALGKNPEEAKHSAFIYQTMELALLKLDDIYRPGDYETYDPSTIKVEMHYLANKFFLEEKYILKNASKLKMPVRLIVGRYDLVTPPLAAYQLAERLADHDIIWTINGHLRQHEAKNVQNILLKQLLAA